MATCSSKTMTCRRTAIAACLVLLATLAGCGPSDGKIPISGVVLVDGAPLPQANLAFVGNSGGGFATCSTDELGKFSVRAYPGLNKVSVAALDNSGADEWADIDEEEMLAGTPEEMAAAEKNMPMPLVAQKYFNADTSGLEVTVEAGMDDITIEVTKED